MSNRKTNFQITIGYKAIVTFNVNADDEESAKKIALEKVKEDGIYKGELQEESYAADGILNMDRTWNQI